MKSLRLLQRIEPTALDKERNFLTRIVGHPIKKVADASKCPANGRQPP
jgi:hypothetical protein